MKKVNIRKPIKKAARGVGGAVATAAMSAFLLWSITGSYTLEFISDTSSKLPDLVSLDIDFVDPETGTFTAEAKQESGSVWEVVGSLKGEKIEFEFTSPLGEDRIVATGVIDEDGVLSGRAANTDGEAFEWESTEGQAMKLQDV